ncbi:MAG TPA: DUF5687 family protein [Puia sp.]|nr:DUF5687 family protein [Puia sp.]
MILTLLSHQWKSFWRGRGAGKSLALQIFMGFLFLYLLACCLVLGIELSFLLKKLYPGQDIIRQYCGLILYYFAIDLVLRFLFQELPVLATQPYLALDIRRGKLVDFLNIRSLFYFLNLVPLFLFLPFDVTTIVSSYGGVAATAFALGILLLTAFNHFLMLYVLRKAYLNGWWMAGFVVAIALFVALDHFHLFSLSTVSAFLGIMLLHSPWLVIVPLALFIIAYTNNRRFLLKNLYVEELSKKTGSIRSTEYTWLQRWGIIGELIGLDIRLVMRNKRPRAMVISAALFLLYGLIIFRSVYLHPFNTTLLLFGSLLITGMFLMGFGRFTFAWNSNSFDGLLTANLPMGEYIREKLLLYTAVASFSFVLTTAYGFIDWRLLPLLAATWLYNIGVNSTLTIWFATYSYKSIDLSKGNSFNYEGSGGTTAFIHMLIFMVGPLAIYLPFQFLHRPWTGVAVVGAVGLAGLLGRLWWIDLITKGFYKRKYLMLQGFREK